MKLFMFGFAALLVTGSVFAADAPNVIHDKVGFFVHLDVAKVLSSTDTYGQCGIVPARLDYLDHQNREHVMDYQVQAIGCPSDN
ncbi:MAG TPA: DUF2790 domain-containing protein [Gammaproteobacteria bacterium]|jgi:hypothetical protein|uniref:DUF2790 domain-containing protein n=1 Tax=Pseudomonas cremoris TaxID=2724178 RepID=A0A7X1DWL4_9PSED|nr:DUF2790 domain-containing protein [Pseudomonas cremoris]MBC2379911.1 DUF2790 domain-containing protein [Pseudomonas cremoris]MBC2404484.1 DUF2790 domain-containing protein [Pseudomonas cremoris]HEC54968.1 DUF2790 domain-containing protein [Gammaproteobacteria bacterium]